MSLALTIALCLRDDEERLADMAKAACTVAEALIREHAAGDWRDGTRELASPVGEDLDYELLALDESSRDNTLSVLSILHAKLPQLRTMQDIEPGTAVLTAARAALGRVWLLADAPFDPQRGLWAARQVFCGDPAALVPGEGARRSPQSRPDGAGLAAGRARERAARGRAPARHVWPTARMEPPARASPAKLRQVVRPQPTRPPGPRPLRQALVMTALRL